MALMVGVILDPVGLDIMGLAIVVLEPSPVVALMVGVILDPVGLAIM
jgi:hypothetical protein